MPKKGQKMSEEHKRKIAEAHKGKKKSKWSPETREKVMAARKAKPMSDETRAKLSAASKKRDFTDEAYRQRLGVAMKGKLKGRKLSEEHRKAISDGVNRRLAEDPTISQKLSAAGKKRYQNSDELEKTRKQLAGMRNDPDAIAKRTLVMSTPEMKARLSESARQYMNKPETKAKMSTAVSEAGKRNWANPEFKTKMQETRSPKLSANAKRQWQDPAFREMMITKARDRFNRMWADPERYEHMARQVSQNGSTLNFKAGVHTSPKAGEVTYRSSYELEIYKQLDELDDVASYHVEPFIIRYKHDGKTKNYIPDLLIEYTDGNWLVVEIKPESRLDEPMNIAKFAAAQQQFGDRFEIWSEELIFNG